MEKQRQRSNTGTGVILLNMGGPGSSEEVQAYLYELLSDPMIVQLPLGKYYQHIFAEWISRRRAEEARKRYNLIGGRSPLVKETRQIASQLQARLGIPVFYAMRYGQPKVSETLTAILSAGIRQLIGIPLYPQYSKVTSGSSILDLKKNLPGGLRLKVVEQHYNHPRYIQAVSDLLNKSMEGISESLKTHVIFAAHSLPIKYVRRGDPYVEQIKATMDSVIKQTNLTLPATLSFQSRIGPVKWQGPSLERVLAALSGEGVEQLIVVPLSFVTENLGTLYDLDIAFKDICLAAGISKLFRIPAVGTSALYIETLAELFSEYDCEEDLKNE